MNTLQITPVTGVQAPSASTAPAAGEAVPTPPQPTNHEQHPASVTQSIAAANAAAAKAQAEAVRNESPAFDLKVGLVSGTFKVYVDLTDSADHRVIARLYGPRGETQAVPPPTPPKVSAEA